MSIHLPYLICLGCRCTVPELNPEMDVFRIGTLLELCRDIATALALDGRRVKVCVQKSMGQGVFQVSSHQTQIVLSQHVIISFPLSRCFLDSSHPFAVFSDHGSSMSGLNSKLLGSFQGNTATQLGNR